MYRQHDDSMKKTLIIVAAAILGSISARAAEKEVGQIAYALPQTSICFDVKAVKTEYIAGPYAAYAKKYLGYSVGLKNECHFTLSDLKIRSMVEADQTAMYSLSIPASGLPLFAQMSTQGLVITNMDARQKSSHWRFPLSKSQDFGETVRPSNLAKETSTLYKDGEGTVRQSVIVEKNIESKAKEAADMIFSIREKRYKILVGDTDATYSGEAMKAAIDALEKMEKEYLALFIGHVNNSEQAAQFEIVPSAGNEAQLYVAFRISDSEGLVGPENVSGKPYYLSLKAEPISQPVSNLKGQKPVATVAYRIPAICNASLSDGMNNVLQTRIPVYQLGTLSYYSIFK